MKVFYSDHFALPLPDGHRFPGSKYTLLRERLVAEGVVEAGDLRPAGRASRTDLLRAHDTAYVDAVSAGTLEPSAVRRIGFPWSEGLVGRVEATVGGAIGAAEQALRDGISGQIAGGTHHAHRDFGSGFCVYNDFAVTALHLIGTGQVSRVAIIDLDVHQGDGNAAILSGHPDVFVFSMHGERNFPFRKHDSDLDVGLPDGTGDAAYLHALDTHLPEVFAFRPGIVLYQAGVDPLAEDRLGRLSLTHAGLRMRDRMVLDACARGGIPVSLGLGGGYAEPIDATVTANLNTWAEARAHF